VTARGAVELEHGTAVKLARSGATVSPGDSLVTPKGAQASISSQAGEGKAALAGGSRLSLDAKHCSAKGGWRFVLGTGAVTASVPAGASAKGSYQTATARATVSGARGSTWRVELAGGKTNVRALRGTVTVVKKSGAPATLKAGQSTVIR
jgi:hypothetical protein